MASLEKITRKKLGELLIADGQVNQDQIDTALDQQQETGERVGEILVSMGWVTESDIARCLCTQFSVPFIRATSYDIPKECHVIVPAQMLIENHMIILDRFQDRIIVAMADPPKKTVLEAIKENTGCEIDVFVATLSDVRNALRKHFPDYYEAGSDQPVFDMTMATSITDDEAMAQVGEDVAEAEGEEEFGFGEGDDDWESLFEEAEEQIMSDLEAKTAEVDRRRAEEDDEEAPDVPEVPGEEEDVDEGEISEEDVEGILDQVLGEAEEL